MWQVKVYFKGLEVLNHRRFYNRDHAREHGRTMRAQALLCGLDITWRSVWVAY